MRHISCAADESRGDLRSAGNTPPTTTDPQPNARPEKGSARAVDVFLGAARAERFFLESRQGRR
jgi:hypothetical protein